MKLVDLQEASWSTTLTQPEFIDFNSYDDDLLDEKKLDILSHDTLAKNVCEARRVDYNAMSKNEALTSEI